MIICGKTLFQVSKKENVSIFFFTSFGGNTGVCQNWRGRVWDQRLAHSDPRIVQFSGFYKVDENWDFEGKLDRFQLVILTADVDEFQLLCPLETNKQTNENILTVNVWAIVRRYKTYLWQENGLQRKIWIGILLIRISFTFRRKSWFQFLMIYVGKSSVLHSRWKCTRYWWYLFAIHFVKQILLSSRH